MEKRFSGRRWEIPSTLYSDTTLLYPGRQISFDSLTERLQDLGYHESEIAPVYQGYFQQNQDQKQITLYTNELDLPVTKRPGFPAVISFQNGFITGITHGISGEDLTLLELEPEIIMEFFNRERELRKPVDIKSIPETMAYAVLAAEDARFYSHFGIDPAGILRALYTNFKSGSIRQGGSTLTQQLAKNYFLTHDRTYSRKIQELFLSIAIEIKFQKDEILEIYLNEIYFGQNGSVSINGIGKASEFYFGKSTSDISLGEQAALAGMIKGPNLYSPYINPEKCKTRRNSVLSSMLSHHWITQTDYRNAVAEEIDLSGYSAYRNKAPYFLDYVYSQLSDLYSEDTLTSMGLSIYTTLDTHVQKTSENVLENGLMKIEQIISARNPAYTNHLQGAILVMHPRTGHILAMVGGRNYQQSQYNRVTQAKRQSGSCFKPIVVSLFLDRFKPSDLLSNEEKTYQTGNTTWTPKNFSETDTKEMTVCDMLKQSANRAAADLMVRGGVDDAVQKIQAFGFSTQFKPYPSLILGATDVVPMDMALAYSVFAANGIQPYPLSLKGVADDLGNIKLRKHIEMKTVLAPAEAFIMTSMLKTVIQEGTGKTLKKQGIFFPVAGKTGTTNDFRDGWFIGYTPDILALVWVGHDDGSSILLPAGQTALPIWSDLMNSLPEYISGHDFVEPPGVLKKTICRESGMLAIRKRCTDTHDEYFLDHLVPSESCDLHKKKSGNIIRGIKNIFKKKQDDQDARP